ncbi:Uncharacterised protein g8076 [Pycnogonum litorale]
MQDSRVRNPSLKLKFHEDRTFRQMWKDFASESSVHGVSKTVSGHFLRRAIWTILVLTAIGLSINQWYLIVRTFYKKETFTSFGVEKQNGPILPSVTICHQNLKFSAGMKQKDREVKPEFIDTVSNNTKCEHDLQVFLSDGFNAAENHPVILDANLGVFHDFADIRPYFNRSFYKLSPCMTLDVDRMPKEFQKVVGNGPEFGYTFVVKTDKTTTRNPNRIPGIMVTSISLEYFL